MAIAMNFGRAEGYMRRDEENAKKRKQPEKEEGNYRYHTL